MRSKGLLQDFANGDLSRVCAARSRAYSGTGDSTDDEDKDYDKIRGTTLPPPFLPSCHDILAVVQWFSDVRSLYGS